MTERRILVSTWMIYNIRK